MCPVSRRGDEFGLEGSIVSLPWPSSRFEKPVSRDERIRAHRVGMCLVQAVRGGDVEEMHLSFAIFFELDVFLVIRHGLEAFGKLGGTGLLRVFIPVVLEMLWHLGLKKQRQGCRVLPINDARDGA